MEESFTTVLPKLHREVLQASPRFLKNKEAKFSYEKRMSIEQTLLEASLIFSFQPSFSITCFDAAEQESRKDAIHRAAQ